MIKSYQFIETRDGRFDAWTKAPEDVARILDQAGCKRIRFGRIPCKSGVFLKLWSRVDWGWQLVSMFFRSFGALYVLQYPQNLLHSSEVMRFFKILRRVSKTRFIVLVHDLQGYAEIEDPNDYRIPKEMRAVLSLCDRIVVHTDAMRKLFVRNGVDEPRLRVLEIFDYLTEYNPVLDKANSKRVIVAGNLRLIKGRYLTLLKTIIGVEFDLFGRCYEAAECDAPNVHYLGERPPSQLPQALKGGFGLIWDGPSTRECAGKFGAYMRINSPHKLSLYLASGRPVIIWSRAAQAELVRKYGVGLVIDSLNELPTKLASLTCDEICKMQQRALEFGAKLRSGYFTRRMLLD